MTAMTDKQMQFIAWLITTVIDQCEDIGEVQNLTKEIRKQSV